MRLLVFSPSYPPRLGGLETHAAEFNHSLAQLSDIESIVVYTPQLKGFGVSLETVNEKITIIRFPAFELIPNFTFPKIWTVLFWIQWFHLFSLKPTIVISRTRFFFTSIMAWCYAFLSRCIYIHIEHGSDFVQLASKWKSWAARLYDYTLGAWVLRHSTRNIAISHAVAAFVSKFDQRPVDVIYRGVDQETILSVVANTEYRRKLPDSLLVVFVGRLIDGKGVADLLTVAPILQPDKVEFLIIGDGPQEIWLKRSAKQQKITNMHFLGRKNVKDAVAIVKGSDIFINPSYTEGLPTSVIEAALCGVAIVATDVGGTNEIIEQNKSGLLISPRHPGEIIEAIKMLKDDPALRKKIGHAANKSARSLFSWSNSCDTYIKVFKSVLHSNDKNA